MAWVWLIIAGLLEIGWAVGLKATDGWTRLVPSLLTAFCMVLSLFVLSRVLKTLPISLAYPVWVGIGSVGVALVGMGWMGESCSPFKLFCLCLIVAGIVGLKMASPS
ncbi:multidrug efflux SMR transporter [Vampirovibrio sp.]|uniref:DMT family transporter n=1 Tax=Vampirovibrio sp. TaxID=2717857 RepID=UPI0035940221